MGPNGELAEPTNQKDQMHEDRVGEAEHDSKHYHHPSGGLHSHGSHYHHSSHNNEAHEQSDKSNCPLNECGCEPPFRTRYMIDEKSGCEICECVAGCPRMVCGCPPEYFDVIIKDEKTGCNHCACYPKNPYMNPSKCMCPGSGEEIGLVNPTNLKCQKGYELRPHNYAHQCSDGSWIDCSGPDWICMGPNGELAEPTNRKDVQSFSFNASAAKNNGLILFLAVIGICMTLFYGVQYTRKLFKQDYTPIMEEEA